MTRGRSLLFFHPNQSNLRSVADRSPVRALRLYETMSSTQRAALVGRNPIARTLLLLQDGIFKLSTERTAGPSARACEAPTSRHSSSSPVVGGARGRRERTH